MKHKNYIDYMKAIGIILVVLGHINYANSFLKDWIYAFHMPLFFVSTGLTVKPLQELSFRQEKLYILKKAKSLLVPYILWGLIYAGYSPRNLLMLLYGSYSTIKEVSLSSLWFLPAMFWAVCLLELIRVIDCRHRLGKWTIGLIGAGCLCLPVMLPSVERGYPFCLDVSVLALGFILFGLGLERGMGHLEAYTRKYGRWFYLLLGLLGFAGTRTYAINPVSRKSYVLMANLRLGSLPVFLVTSLCGCVMVYALARALDGGKTHRMLSFLGRNSLVIFAVHKELISYVSKIFDRIWLPKWAVLGISLVLVLAVSCVLCCVINSFVPCLGSGGATRGLNRPENK